MNTELAQRVTVIKPSPTLVITARAAQLRAEGQDVLSLSAGEPDFDTPSHIKDAAKQAIEQGLTKYTAVDGTASLKKAVINKLANDNQLQYTPEQILVSCGAKHSIYNLLQAIINTDDEVIIPAPYWVSYPDMVKLTGGKPVIVPATIEQNFKITPAQLATAITPKTRLLILNSPSNPTGVAYSKAELQALGEVLTQHPQVTILTDDIYEHILWSDEPFANIAMACPQLIDRTVVINGVSKAYAMTGWRIGYAAGPADLIKAMKKIQSQSTSNPASISQAAAEAALSGSQDCVKTMTVEFKKRHDYFVAALNKLPGIQCLESHGTFYAFPNIEQAIAKIDGVNNDVEFAEHLLTSIGIAAVPGTAFGAPGCIRFSYASSMATLEDAIARLKKVC